MSVLRQGSRSGREDTLRADFLLIEADDGTQGVYGPLEPELFEGVLHPFRRLLIGMDVELAERSVGDSSGLLRHGHTGYLRIAQGAMHCALIDLVGKIKGKAAGELLGVKFNPHVTCYLSLLGLDYCDPEAAVRTCLEVCAANYWGQKWALRIDPSTRYLALRESVRAVRELSAAAAGERLMFDALGGWTVDFTRAFCKLVEKFQITFLEEPLPAANWPAYRGLASSVQVPLAWGEHFYSRHEFEASAMLAYAQPDTVWVGGLREAARIGVWAAREGVQVLPHGASMLVAAHLAALSAPQNVPAIEYHATLEMKRQFFWKRNFRPKNGCIDLTGVIGLGVQIDFQKAEQVIVL